MRLLRHHRAAQLRLSLLACGALAACSGGERPPDVLFISLDSVRADDLTFRDERAAPQMTRLAERGAIFEQAVSGSSWTLPAHAQMFTGNPPAVHGVQIDTIRIDPEHPTLPELLGARGYHTLGFWTGWYLADEYGFARGFDLYQSSMTIDPAANGALRRALAERGDSEEEIEDLLKEVASHQDITSAQLVADAREALAAVDDERPVFLFAHFFDPHYDYIPPPPHDTRFDPGYTGFVDGRNFWEDRRIYDAAKSPPRQVSDRDLEHVRALYRGEIAWTDAAVGQLLELFEQRRGLEQTLVVITADHGEEFFEHGNRGHRSTLFDEVLRVPLLIAAPDSGPARAARGTPRVIRGQVTLSDLLPTVLDLAGGAIPPGLHGRSLRPWLDGGSLPERGATSSLLVRIQPPDSDEASYVLTQALRTPAEKYVRTLLFQGNRQRLRSFVRYDLSRDPGELAPRLDYSPREALELWNAFEDGLEPVRATFDGLPHSSASERGTRARERFSEELGPLGYLDGEDSGGGEQSAPKRWLWSPLPRLDPPQ